MIRRDQNGQYKVIASHHPVAEGLTSGMLWGVLFGLLFFDLAARVVRTMLARST